MRENMRDSGIEVVGDLDWGSHFCVFYHGKEELEPLLVSFIRAGLEGGEACVWVTSGTIKADEAKAALERAIPDFDKRAKSGQIEIIKAKDWYTKTGKFDSEEVFAGWNEKAMKAKERGFKGLRATGDTSWLSTEDWDKFVEYESNIEPRIRGQNMIVLCSYSLALWEAYQMIDVVSTHEFALIMREGAWRQIENSEHRKVIEHALEAEEKYRRVVQNIHVAVYSALPDEHSTVVLLTDKIEGITGYAAKEFLDDPTLYRRMIHPDDLERVRIAVAEHRRGKSPLRIQYRVLSKEGELRWVKDEAVPIIGSHGDVVRIDGFVEDITEHKELEESLANTNQELEAFSYSVSHDLRAPLRRIDGFSEILLRECRGKLVEEEQKHLERIQKAAREMDGLIENILRLSRVNTTELRKRTVDLADLAREAIERLKAEDPSRQVKVEIHGRLATYGDPDLLSVAIQNLLGNAWKFTSRNGDASVELGARTVDGRHQFYVKDNGVGFDMAQISRLFAPFQRLHSKSEFPGEGIGLALTKRIVSKHGGKIWAESAVGKGATFYFTLGEDAEGAGG